MKSHSDQDLFAKPVEVILPIYHGNSLDEVKSSLTSILQQNYPKILVTIVVDGVVDNTIKDYLDTYSDYDNFKKINLPRNIGLSKALNIAIKQSKCEYIARMDADDISLKDRISEQVKFMEKNPNVDILGTSALEKYGKDYIVDNVPTTHDECFRYFSIQNPVLHPTVLFRQTFFQKAGLYPEVRTTEDSLMWSKGFSSGAIFANINIPLYIICIDDKLIKRRSSFKAAIDEVRVRFFINKQCNFGFNSYLFVIVKSIMLFTIPVPIIRLAYKLRAKLSQNKVTVD